MEEFIEIKCHLILFLLSAEVTYGSDIDYQVPKLLELSRFGCHVTVLWPKICVYFIN